MLKIIYIIEKMYGLGATAENNGQSTSAAVQTTAGSVTSYQSSGGSPESQSALSPVHSPQEQNGVCDANGIDSPMLRELSDPDYHMAFKQVVLPSLYSSV